MSNEQDNQFERVARYLDGEDVELTAVELELLDEFNRNEAVVGAQLDVEVPRETVQRAQRRMNAAVLAKPRTAMIFKLAGAAAVAAIMVLGIGLFWGNFTGRQIEPQPTVAQTSPDAADIAADAMMEAIEEQLAMQEEEEVLALLEPLYDEDSVEFWDEYDDETDEYLDFNGA
ncbi:MAG: hypothetical protein KAR11_06730 [Phycisphaerae bacterium]|nr:hypothetical protein [Phycisphaerae bacterium]